ncbi:protein IQ-DOMAIN 32-like [Arachis stenosperma]|uniref:protein IQ-DOMAIN 32-like n=1 Tax=Arachis stenosperma TaxID=217475 RepID=UPI0025AC8E37|nr:protein IQ-DOMAIN 32-like [Arachis stenosperma]
MGRPASCFKLIICGGDAAEKDGYRVAQIKDSNDKPGWSFRKKSVTAKQRVLSNTVTADSSSANKESSQCNSFNFEPNVVDKVYTTNNSDKKPNLSSIESSETNVIEAESKKDVNPPESAVITIQAAIRGLLAQRDLMQIKNLVKLQAAVRGHLVRSHAVGTLRCVQAIAKMQLLVRARRAQQSQENQSHMSKSNVMDASIEKLLSSRFARQLLESTPKNKPIHVKCDPSKADSAWKWLERWMSMSSKYTSDDKKTSSLTEESEVYPQTADTKPSVEDSILPSRDEKKPITHDANNFSFQAIRSPSPSKKAVEFGAKVASAEIGSFKDEKSASDVSARPEVKSLPQKPEIDGEPRKRSMKRYASDQLEAERNKSGHGSRKVSNPAFIAAQSKFEELSSMINSGRTSSFSDQTAAVESEADTSSVNMDMAYRSKELSENSGPFFSKLGGSQCGTKLSISSTLDTPNVSEVGPIEDDQDAKDLEGVGNLDKKTNLDVDTDIPGAIPSSHLATAVMDQTETVDEINGIMVHSSVAVDSEEPVSKTEKNASDVQRDQNEDPLQGFRSSREASPKTHTKVPESQETPSSQLSMKPKDGKDKFRSNSKLGTPPVVNKSPVNGNHDSSSRGQPSGKRRNSFGSVKADHIDQEPTGNTNNNSPLPRFMQATESAKAKTSANNTPRSSPDVHERDVQVTKRHSLPGATGRQVSPRIQQSMSQPQQNPKGYCVQPQPTQERKWVR